jgi:hypothetical protein
MTGPTDDDLVRLLAAAVPRMPAPPDRMERVGALVRRRRNLTTVGALAVLVLTLLAVSALPRFLASARPVSALPISTPSPHGTGGSGDEDPICGPEPYLTPATSPFGGSFPPHTAGLVRVTLCEWRLEGDRYALQRRLIVTEGIADVVRAVLAAPEGEVPPFSPDAYGCTEADRGLQRRLLLQYDDAPGQWIALTCDVLWQSSWARFGGRAVVDTVERRGATQPSPSRPLPARPTS